MKKTADTSTPDTRPTDGKDNSSIVIKDARKDCLETSEIRALLCGAIDAVRVTNVASDLQCSELCENALAHEELHPHAGVKMLDILGTPHYLAVEDEEVEEVYYSNARKFMPAIREMSVRVGSPMDAVVAVLNDSWPTGVVPGRLDTERPMPPCIFRIYPPYSHGVEPHIDDLRQEVPRSQVANSLIGQLGFNLYLSLPADGGALIIYDRKPTLAEFQAKATGYSWALEDAGEPRHVIVPSVGELILINTRQLHAVGACYGPGNRATLSGFGGAISEHIPLMIWA